MSHESTMRFSIPNWTRNYCIGVLGCIDDTEWSVLSSFEGSYICVEIIRSLSNDNVTVDVEMLYEFNSLGKFKGERYLEGVISRRLYFPLRITEGALRGYVTVHYDPTSTLSSKNEAVTQTDSDFSSPQLANDLLCLLNNPDSYSDATLVCGPAKFPVHKAILSARSPVFAAMFRTQMQEGRKGVVDIVDMEPDVLMAMLRYIYSSKTDPLTHSLAGDLLFAADKYQLEELKMKCIGELKASMDTNNVFRSVLLGDLHDKSLKKFALEFICGYKNLSALEKTDEWQSLLKEHPSLVVEVTTAVAKYLQ